MNHLYPHERADGCWVFGALLLVIGLAGLTEAPTAVAANPVRPVVLGGVFAGGLVLLVRGVSLYRKSRNRCEPAGPKPRTDWVAFGVTVALIGGFFLTPP